jgi:putative transferase (TIGR04331 family)
MNIVPVNIDHIWSKKNKNIAIYDIREKKGYEYETGKGTSDLSKKEMHNIIKKGETIYREVFDLISKWMNYVHNVSYSSTYWEILLGKFVRGQVDHLYSRYKVLTKLNEESADLRLRCISDKKFETPVFSEYEDSLHNKFFDWQYYSQASKATDIHREKLSVDFDLVEEINVSSHKENISNTLKSILNYTYFMSGRKVVLYNTQLSRSLRWWVLAISGFDIVSADMSGVKEIDVIPDIKHDLRSSINKFLGKDDIINMILQGISSNIPKIYVEGYSIARDNLSNYTNEKANPDVILCGRSSYFPFLLWKSEAYRRGTKIISVQHGSGYGELAWGPERYEHRISDTFITWGWGDKDEGYFPMPASKMVGKKRLTTKNPDGVLWLGRGVKYYTGEVSGHVTRKRLHFESPDKYAERQSRFYQNLSSHTKSKVRFRPKPSGRNKSDLKKICIEKLKQINVSSDYMNDVVLASQSISLRESSKKYKMVIVDHFPSTAFLELLALGIPVIMYADLDYRVMSNRAKNHYKALEEVGVVHQKPQSAAKQIDESYYCSDKWWNEAERQKHISKFVHMFARNEKNSEVKWSQYLTLL